MVAMLAMVTKDYDNTLTCRGDVFVMLIPISPASLAMSP